MAKKKPAPETLLRQAAEKLDEAGDLLDGLTSSAEVKLLGEEIRDVMTRVRQAADVGIAA